MRRKLTEQKTEQSKKKLQMRETKMASHNGRFGAMAAVTPQKMQYEFGSYYPAGSSVEAATAPSRWDVSRHPDSDTVKTG